MDNVSKIKFARNSLDNVRGEVREFISEHSELFSLVEESKLCDNCDYFFYCPKDLRLKYHRSESGELFFDLQGEISYHRSKNYSLKSEPLAKALGIKSRNIEQKRIVFDVTAGTGKDMALIYAFGAEVYAFERSPIIYLLLSDAVAMAELNIKVIFGDSSKLNLNDLPRPDVVFYDPMYPEKKKSALPRKEMQIFKEIIGPDTDSDTYLEFAMSLATERVVVKRSLHAPEVKPGKTAEYLGKSTRYDMYKILV